MALDLAAARHQLALLARRKRARVLGWPRDWRPHEVIDPRDKQPLTDAGAWEMVADLLEVGCSLEEVELESPPGKLAYVIQTTLNDRQLYVKLELGSGTVIARSFHYSVYRN